MITYKFQKILLSLNTMVDNKKEYPDQFYPQTKKFYNKCATVYDYLYPDHLKYSKALFEELIPKFKKNNVKKIIDASCGIGHDMSILLENGFKVDGADICNIMLSEARQRLNQKGYVDYKLFKIDARNISKKVIAGNYDAVLFRGNTFSNIKPHEINVLLYELLKIIKNGGLICIDFRDGEEQLKQKKRHELRGYGISLKKKELYFSYYKLIHSSDINLTYKVIAHIFKLNLTNFLNLKHEILEINSHYVNTNNIISLLNQELVNIEILNTKKIGLPYLKTIIGKKNG